jgi:hypothetical protein
VPFVLNPGEKKKKRKKKAIILLSCHFACLTTLRAKPGTAAVSTAR